MLLASFYLRGISPSWIRTRRFETMQGALVAEAATAYPLNRRLLEAPFFSRCVYQTVTRPFTRSDPAPKAGPCNKANCFICLLHASFTRYVSLYLRNQRLPPFKAEAGRCSYLYKTKSVYVVPNTMENDASEATALIAAVYDPLFRTHRKRFRLLFSKIRPVLDHNPRISLFCCLRPGLLVKAHCRLSSSVRDW